MIVTDTTGARHEVDMPAARSEEGREEVVWLGQSLLSPVLAPPPEGPPPPEESEVVGIAPTIARAVDAAPRESQAILAAPSPPVAVEVPAGEGRPARLGWFGVGIVAGVPSGMSTKLALGSGREHAFEATAGTLGSWRRWSTHASYLWTPVRIAEVGGAGLFAHVGVGGVIDVELREGYATVHNRPRIGARAPVGLDLRLPQASVEGFAEVAPAVMSRQRGRVQWGFTVGGRYFF